MDIKRNWIGRKAEIILLGARNFFSAIHLQQATALTYYSLFAVVPLAALFFGIAKGFDLQNLLRGELQRRLNMLPAETLERIYEFAEKTLQQASGGVIAGIGVFVLLWTVMRLASNIEQSFNLIWHVRKGRKFFRKLSDYLSLLIIAPILIIVLSSLTIFADQMATKLFSSCELAEQIGIPVFSLILEHILPLLLAWALFSFIYIFVPNTRVKFSSALFAGFIAALLYLAAQMVYIKVQGALFQNKIYGSLALLPLFLIWIQWSWMIALFGSEIAFVDQNFATGQFEKHEFVISEEERLRCAISLAAIVVCAYEKGDRPMPENRIAEATGFPLFRVRELLNELTGAGILYRMEEDINGEAAYLVGTPTDTLTVLKARQMLLARGSSGQGTPELKEYRQLSGILDRMEESSAAIPENRLLRDL